MLDEPSVTKQPTNRKCVNPLGRVGDDALVEATLPLAPVVLFSSTYAKYQVFAAFAPVSSPPSPVPSMSMTWLPTSMNRAKVESMHLTALMVTLSAAVHSMCPP